MNYKEKLYKKYVESHLTPRKGNEYHKLDRKTFISFNQRFKKHVLEYKSKRVVDLGSGSGHLLNWLSELNFIDLKGIEINSDLTKFYPSHINHENIDINSFLVNKTNFDLIFLKDVLEHFNKDEAFQILENIFISLNKDGRLIIQVPNAESPLFGRVLYGDYTHEQSFTATGLLQILNAIGFQNIKIKSYFPAIYNISSFLRHVYFRLISVFYYLLILSETNIKDRYVSMNIIVIADKK